MENSEISIQELQIINVLRLNPSQWFSNHEIKKMIGIVSDRTVRARTLKLVNLGLVDQVKVFPSHKYRWSETAAKQNASYVMQIDKAAEVFGLQPVSAQ